MDGQPGARMRDVVHPDIELPAPAKLRQALERGEMVLDVLLRQGVPVAYARSHIDGARADAARPRRHRAGRDGDDRRRSRSST